MTFAIDRVDGCGLSNEMRCEFQPKTTKMMLRSFIIKGILPAVQYKQDGERFSFKSGHVVQVCNL